MTSTAKAIVASVAIMVIGGLEVTALLMGINGAVLTASVATISLIVGYVFGKKGTTDQPS